MENIKEENQMGINIVYPWKMCGRYADDFEIIVGGADESDCMEKLIGLTEKHGDLVWYTGYTDEDYVAGEYIGRENFIYE